MWQSFLPPRQAATPHAAALGPQRLLVLHLWQAVQGEVALGWVITSTKTTIPYPPSKDISSCSQRWKKITHVNTLDLPVSCMRCLVSCVSHDIDFWWTRGKVTSASYFKYDLIPSNVVLAKELVICSLRIGTSYTSVARCFSYIAISSVKKLLADASGLIMFLAKMPVSVASILSAQIIQMPFQIPPKQME